MASFVLRFEELPTDLRRFCAVECPHMGEDEIWRFVVCLAELLAHEGEGPFDSYNQKMDFFHGTHRFLVREGTIELSLQCGFQFDGRGVTISLSPRAFFQHRSYLDQEIHFGEIIKTAMSSWAH